MSAVVCCTGTMEPMKSPPTNTTAQRRSRRAILGWSGVGVLVLLGLIALIVNMSDTRPGVSISNSIATGKRPTAPAIPRRVLADAGTSKLPSWYRTSAGRTAPTSGHILVVNVWASWCGPCREETPMLVSIGEEYSADGVQVIGLNPASEDAERDARAFAREFKVNYPLVRVTQREKDAWGVRGFPETFIVGRDGRISAKINGPIDETTAVKLIERELDQHRSAS